MSNSPTRINNYEELKAPLDKTNETEITFEEKGEDFVFEVDNKQYSLSKLNKNLIDVYQMQNEKMNLIIKTTENLENLKEDVKEDIENNKETIKLDTIDDYINTFKERKKATKYNKRYEDGTASLDLIHNTAKDAIDELKAKKKSFKRAPAGHTSIFDKDKYDAKLEKMGTIRDTATDSERPVENFQAHDLDDANRNNEYNKETIDYQLKFNGLLKELAKDKFKIKEYASITKYFQDVIDGTIEHPEQEPYQCKYREDYKYLFALKTKYPKLSLVIRDPDGNTETVDDNNPENPLNKTNKTNKTNETNETINITDESLEGDGGRERTKDALKKGGIVDFVGQGLKEGLGSIGLDLNFTKQQQNTLRIAGVIGGGILLWKGIKKRWKKKDRKLRKVGLIAAAADALYIGMTGRELYSSTIKTLFGKGSSESKWLAGLMGGNIFSKIDEVEEKSEKKPSTLMFAAGRATPSNKVLKVENGKFKIDKPQFDIEVAQLPEDQKKDAIKYIEKILKADDTDKVLNKTMKLLGISVKDYEDEKNKNKPLVEIANDQKETKGSQLEKLETELKERGYQIMDEGRYPIYLDYDKGDDIDKKIEERSHKYIARVSNANPKKKKDNNKVDDDLDTGADF